MLNMFTYPSVGMNFVRKSFLGCKSNELYSSCYSRISGLATFSRNLRADEPALKAIENEGDKRNMEQDRNGNFLSNLRFKYPEFLPDPNIERRNLIREKLERADMLKRRSNIDIPTFYSGCIMAVTRSNEHAPDKSSRFVGICIQRLGAGLKAEFTLRNVIEGLGFEMKFFLYDPTISKIEVLRMEKRLDDELLYLRDALPEYYTFPLDMEPEILPEGAPIPVNTTKVKLKPRPWRARWERFDLKGVDQELIDSYITEKMKMQREMRKTPWEKFDLMKQYRLTIPEEEQTAIFAEVSSELHKQELSKKKLKKKREFIKPKKSG